MPTFDTPNPISATIDIAAGDIRLRASDRATTVVEVHPSNAARADDVRTAEQTRVEYRDGALLIKTPEGRGFFGRGGSVDVTVELPADSHLRLDAASADFRAQGRLGECRVKIASGDVQMEQTHALRLSVSDGDITVGHVADQCEVSCASGDVRIREIDGQATIKNTNGETWIGEVGGELQLNAANGDIKVDRAQTNVRARTANGDIRLGEIARGAVLVDTASGEIEIGVRQGSAAWLDLVTISGHVRNTLESTDGPASGEETVEIRARTASGNIAIRRAATGPLGGPEGRARREDRARQ